MSLCRNFLALFIVTIAFKFNCEAGWVYDTNKKACATFFSENNYSGFNKSVSNMKAYSDLSNFNLKPQTQDLHESRKMSETWNNQIKSVRVESDCQLRVCVDTHFEGSCKWLKKSESILDSTLSKTISSLGCGCPVPNCEAQTCAAVKLRENECARGFFEPSCNTCDGEFLTIREGQRTEVGKYAEKIASMYVKPGCTLLTFEDEDFKGKETKLASDFMDWDKSVRIRSYNCFCVNPVDTPREPKKIDPNDPPLIDIPLTSRENIELTAKYPDHPGLAAALTSVRNNRSPRNAYILVIGLTGSGKSASINFLFDSDRLATGSMGSVTSHIHEYRIPVQVDELGCQNCELRVIDTPGFGDTGGLSNDASFLAGLEHYLKHHEELKGRLPNIVLIFAKYSDNRIYGKSSPFVKALKGIDLFRDKLFDTKFSNVVTVLTHFMSAISKERKNPAERLNLFRKTIEDYTLFSKPIRIAVAENKPVDQLLPMINGYYKLPNKEFYPLNLFEKIQDATGGHDPIGEAIIRNAFKHPELFNVTELTFNLTGTKFSRENHFLSELNKFNFNDDNSEVSNITEAVFHKDISSDMKRKYPGSLEYTKRVLNLQNIFTLQDVPKTTIGIVKFFKNIRHNPLILELFQKSFDIKIPEFGVNIIAGQSYNILTDSVLPSSPFLKMDSQMSDIGYAIPSTVTCKLMNEIVDVFNVYDTHEEYLRKRIASMKVTEDNIKEPLSGEIRPGFNTLQDIIDDGTKNPGMSSVREYRLFQVTLNADLKLDPEFESVLKDIPPFDVSNHTIVDKWKHFFTKYGTHVVRTVFGGGAIQGKFKVRNPNLPKEETITQYKKSIQEFRDFLNDIYLKKNVKSNDINTTNVVYSLKFLGGDFQHHVHDFSRLTIEQTSRILDGFEDSLAFQPTILTSSLELLPLSEVVRKTSSEGSDKILQAAKSLFNASLIYVPPPPQPPPLERPEVLSHIKNLRDGFNQQIERLTTELKESTETFNNFTQKLVEENKKEREILLAKLANEAEQTKQVIALSCHYTEPALKGTKLCSADMDTCINIRMESVKSVNTHNSCIKFFLGRGCSGSGGVEHKSNAKGNTKFPIEVPDGEYFSVIRCEFAS